MNKILHEICSLKNLLDINRGLALILRLSARSVTGFHNTCSGQLVEPLGPKDEPPFARLMQDRKIGTKRVEQRCMNRAGLVHMCVSYEYEYGKLVQFLVRSVDSACKFISYDG